MRTLALLTAFFLLALMAQAEPLAEKAEDAPEEQLPKGKDQDVAISFTEPRSYGLQRAGRASIRLCFCRTRGCLSLEVQLGKCILNRKSCSFCCLR